MQTDFFSWNVYRRWFGLWFSSNALSGSVYQFDLEICVNFLLQDVFNTAFNLLIYSATLNFKNVSVQLQLAVEVGRPVLLWWSSSFRFFETGRTLLIFEGLGALKQFGVAIFQDLHPAAAVFRRPSLRISKTRLYCATLSLFWRVRSEPPHSTCVSLIHW